MRIKKLLGCLMFCGGLVLASCNTIEGVGRDVESVGDTVADEAK